MEMEMTTLMIIKSGKRSSVIFSLSIVEAIDRDVKRSHIIFGLVKKSKVNKK